MPRLHGLMCVSYYIYYRRHSGLPVRGGRQHDWEKEQIDVITGAEEYELVEQYKQPLNRRDKDAGVTPRWAEEA
jgi:hypothetical protein